jgi:hypothetical protein
MIILSISGCGLEDYPYLYPPLINKAAVGDSSCSFKNSTENNPQYFQGFLVYYRFYDRNADTAADNNYIESQTGASVLSAFQLKNFRPLALISSFVNETALFYEYANIIIPSDSRDDSFIIEINFNTVNKSNPAELKDKFPVLTSGGIIPELYPARNLGGRTSGITEADIRGFSDSDFSAAASDKGSLTSDNIKILLYAVSYGRDENLKLFYSEPLSLGFIIF